MRPATLALIFALVANATANVLIRWGMKDLELSLAQPVATLKSILLNGRVMAGIVLFALNVLAYAYALSKIRLSVAYPVMTSLGLIIVMVLSWQLMGERITPVQVGGTALIIGGVVLVASQMG
ncbi:MAG: SMR family transporter [Candidatus Krumholzibacteriia bacterium]